MDEGFHHETSSYCDFTLFDKNDIEVFNGYTNGTGKLHDILLLESTCTPDDISFSSPFRLNMTGGNNVKFNPGLTTVLWIKANSIDSDDDFILDCQENKDNVHWYEGEDLYLDETRLEKTWEATGEVALLPDDDGIYFDMYFPLPDSDDNDIKIMFRAGPSDQVSGKEITLSLWSVEGYSETSVISNESFRLSSRFRYYTTSIHSISGSSDNLRIRIETQDSGVVLDSLTVIRSSDELGGLITNPVMMDSDKDLIIDGVEQRSGTLWYEAEHFGSGDVVIDSGGSSGYVIRNASNGLISKVPVMMEANNTYRYYYRARSTQDSSWDTVDDFSYNLSDWYAIEDNGTAGVQYEKMHLYLSASNGSISRRVMYTDRIFRTNATFKIGYNVTDPILLGDDARILIGVIDGEDLE